MSESPFFQFYPSDWLGGTRGLTAVETGIYITLVAMMYEQETPINMDHKRLARLCGATIGAFENALDELVAQRKIIITDDGLWNDRTQKEIAKRTEKRSLASASANARWQKTEQNQTPSDANALKPQCGTDANQKPEPDSKKDLDKSKSCPFSDFWAVWPFKVSKAPAEKAWRKLSDDDRTAAKNAAAGWTQKWRAANPSASPIHPTTYLNQRRWHDEIEPPMLRAINGGQSPPLAIPKPDLAAIFARSPELNR